MNLAYLKTTIREIKNSFGRYLAILAIVFLGVGFFCGLKLTKPSMVTTVNQYLRDQNFYDFKLLSTLGFSDGAITELKKLPHVADAEGGMSIDALCGLEGQDEAVYKIHSLPGRINTVVLKEGRMPESSNECLFDAKLFREDMIGRKITVTSGNDEDTLALFKEKTFTVVGAARSCVYMNFERGTTSIGTGKVTGFIYVPAGAFDCDYVTEINVKLTESYDIYTEEYNDYIDGLKAAMEDETEALGNARYDSLLSDAMEEVSDAQKELDEEMADAQKELDDAWKELEDAEEEIRKHEQEIEDAKKEIADAWDEINASEKLLSDQEEQLDAVELPFDPAALEAMDPSSGNPALTDPSIDPSALPFGLADLEAMDPSGADASGLSFDLADLETMDPSIDPSKLPPQQAAQYRQMEEQLARYNAAQEQIKQYNAAKEQLEQYNAAKEQLASGREQIDDAKRELEEKEQELADAEKELEDAKRKLADGWKEYEDALADFQKETKDAQDKIDDALKEIEDLEKPDTYVLTRNQNIGYVSFENDSNIVAAIANVFPVFFFLVAALITMTTMNRMVEEQRTQIGILKALGYSDSAVIFKFTFYAGSAALIGAVTGYAAGRRLFPMTIWQAYGIMYDLGNVTIVFHPYLAVLVTAVALAGAVGTTYLTCRYELVSAPANLIRPKAPKGGKRIFLERITFIWSRMKFLRKVSARNLFRYKKRFFMMILGISGCTALLLTGFGLKDSIMDIADMQYGEIQVYDIAVTLKDPVDDALQASFTRETQDVVERIAYCYEESVDIDFKGKTKTIYLEVPSDPEAFGSFMHFVTEDGSELPYPQDGEAVITSKIAGTLGIKVGDTVLLRDNDMRQLSLKVTGLCRNYVYNYIYMNKETYEACTGTEPLYKSAYTKVKEGADIHTAVALLSDRKDVLSTSATLDVRERLSQMMSSLNYIVLLVIVCAGFLAFIVLYNLTNINITERIREIATIKVLGFYAMETADYVFRENLLLTGMGAAVGLILGKWLHWFVMHNINIDMITFKTYISGKSYVCSLLLTFAFALLVNVFMFLKLERINMAESLKSVE